jgi:hypothetical protein
MGTAHVDGAPPSMLHPPLGESLAESLSVQEPKNPVKSRATLPS